MQEKTGEVITCRIQPENRIKKLKNKMSKWPELQNRDKIHGKMQGSFKTDLLRISQPDEIIRIEKGGNARQKYQNSGNSYDNKIKISS